MTTWTLATLLIASLPDQPTRPPADPDAAFARLLAAAKADPDAADFTALRLAYARTRSYRPYENGAPDFSVLHREIANGERAAGLAALDRLMDGHWVEGAAHRQAALLARRLRDDARSAMHERFQRGLVDSVLASGDGRSFPSAWTVVARSEEREVLDDLGLDIEAARFKLVERDGHHYDVATLRDERLGRALVLHFNVDAFGPTPGPSRAP